MNAASRLDNIRSLYGQVTLIALLLHKRYLRQEIARELLEYKCKSDLYGIFIQIFHLHLYDNIAQL
jgi:hypothetical protein